jgi:NAD(P)-dependent dehydrogenase (short-subunit alcohol dehydrogenase family)
VSCVPGDRVVLITGASSGIGQATATLLATRGFRVYGTSRKPRSDKMDGYEMLKLDVTSDESVSSCVQTLMQQANRLDILVNNAGYGLFGAVEETSIQEAKAQLETNFFGVVRMVKAALPIMRRQKEGWIINVSSFGGLSGNPFQAFYCASKFALEGYTEALRHEVKRLNVNVSIVEPGWFKTDIGIKAPRAAENLDCYREACERVTQLYSEYLENGGDPKLVAETVMRIVESKSPRLRYAVGEGNWRNALKRVLPESVVENYARKYYGIDG